jgi:uncharacterized protein YuzE
MIYNLDRNEVQYLNEEISIDATEPVEVVEVTFLQKKNKVLSTVISTLLKDLKEISVEKRSRSVTTKGGLHSSFSYFSKKKRHGKGAGFSTDQWDL